MENIQDRRDVGVRLRRSYTRGLVGARLTLTLRSRKLPGSCDGTAVLVGPGLGIGEFGESGCLEGSDLGRVQNGAVLGQRCRNESSSGSSFCGRAVVIVLSINEIRPWLFVLRRTLIIRRINGM